MKRVCPVCNGSMIVPISEEKRKLFEKLGLSDIFEDDTEPCQNCFGTGYVGEDDE